MGASVNPAALTLSRLAWLLLATLSACSSPIRARSIDPFDEWFRTDPWKSASVDAAHQHLSAPPSIWLDEGASRGVELRPSDGVVTLAGNGARFVSRVVVTPASFRELLPSWNVSIPDGLAITVDVRVREVSQKDWSNWLPIGGWSTDVGLVRGAQDSTAKEYDRGRVDVDIFRSEHQHDRAQLRVRAYASEVSRDSTQSVADHPIEIHDLSAVFTDFSHFAPPGERSDDAVPLPQGSEASLRHGQPLPARSQRDVPEELRSRLCSPTSLAMVLESYGVDLPTVQVAECLYDRDNDIYGNWSRAIQGAFVLGVPGRLVRVEDWRVVEAALARNERLIIRVRVQAGELRGAPYRQTKGHLLCLCGIDAQGWVLVNDPAATSEEGVERRYRKEDLEACWMQPSGVAYAIRAPDPH
ncbi:MAG: hypothetical protein ACI841_000966 [Planctomycetota bacterium]|jgi:hypothetical protein